jgi:hypothetical protein
MGFASDRDATLKLGTTSAGDRFRAAAFIARLGPDSAEAIGDLLEKLGLRPYKSGRRPKPDPGKAPLIRNYTRPGR